MVKRVNCLFWVGVMGCSGIIGDVFMLMVMMKGEKKGQ